VPQLFTGRSPWQADGLKSRQSVEGRLVRR
jgi:hypothetical protein